MIFWFTTVQIVIALAAGLLCLGLGLAGRRPSDLSVGSLALVEALLIIQVILAIVGPFVGNAPAGDALEYWAYLISALILPVAGTAWVFIDRSRWSTVVLGIVAIALAVMIWRMHVIWTTPVG